jgi:hypothetical protein
VIKLWQPVMVALIILGMVAGARYVRAAAGHHGSVNAKSAAAPSFAAIEPTRAERALMVRQHGR